MTVSLYITGVNTVYNTTTVQCITVWLQITAKWISLVTTALSPIQWSLQLTLVSCLISSNKRVSQNMAICILQCYTCSSARQIEEDINHYMCLYLSVITLKSDCYSPLPLIANIPGFGTLLSKNVPKIASSKVFDSRNFAFSDVFIGKLGPPRLA